MLKFGDRRKMSYLCTRNQEDAANHIVTILENICTRGDSAAESSRGSRSSRSSVVEAAEAEVAEAEVDKSLQKSTKTIKAGQHAYWCHSAFSIYKSPMSFFMSFHRSHLL